MNPVENILQWFESKQIPDGLVHDVSRSCGEVAGSMVARLPVSPELLAGLRKLLEARDCFVRAALEEGRHKR